MDVLPPTQFINGSVCKELGKNLPVAVWMNLAPLPLAKKGLIDKDEAMSGD